MRPNNGGCRPVHQAAMSPGRTGAGNRGFTLLEVMVAIAILAIALTSIFSSQSQSISLAIETKFNVTASFLAQEKLAEYQAGLVDFYSNKGDFGEDFPGFTWKTEVRDADIYDVEGLRDLEPPIQRIDLTVAWEEEAFTTTITYYGRERKR